MTSRERGNYVKNNRLCLSRISSKYVLRNCEYDGRYRTGDHSRRSLPQLKPITAASANRFDRSASAKTPSMNATSPRASVERDRRAHAAASLGAASVNAVRDYGYARIGRCQSSL
ncbi:hypothetical protein EVAR_34114_1 [Eumeta japonica]|uniref:Uncharacterized protein n=1 Tax=Eumeta variegata TaxID=151549 RepID=A0A4C1WIT8_EUMVA|nr:hypothetical protein EVAR_34114_1 [Eumeta japonica]